jgi:hypothetical protein
VEPEHLHASSERDQLWASLRRLRSDIESLGANQFTGSERERQVVQLLARIILAELDFRAEEGK